MGRHPDPPPNGLLRPAFTLVELMIVVAILAILAMVAIPAFTKYIRRSRTAEATINLRKIYDGSVAFFASERASREHSGRIREHRFPGNTGDAPDEYEVRCCDYPGGKCPAGEYGFGEGESPDNGWIQMNFSLADPHYYHYQYTSTGSDRGAQFSAIANGNLDCDDEWSTFERTGSVDGSLNVVGGGLYTHLDIE